MKLFHEYEPGRKWIARLSHDTDLLQALEEFAATKNIKVGRIEVIGAVKRAALAYYDQDKKEYGTLQFDEPLEIVNCSGNLSLRENLHRAHLHITFGRCDGTTLGGHLMPGTVVFAAEAVIEELNGPELQRGYDPPTGLPLWES